MKINKHPLILLFGVLIHLIFTSSSSAQNIPVDIRNFLIDFEKASCLSEFDNEQLISNKYSANTALKFKECFVDDDVMIYNDIAQFHPYPLYISLKRYVKIADSLYPRGYFVSIQNPRILNVHEFSKFNIYVVEVKKYQRIDSYVEEPPIPMFSSPVLLLLYISDYKDSDDIKLLTIEPKGSALNNKTIYTQLIPDKIGINTHFNSFDLNFNELPLQYSELKQNGSLTSFGLTFDWNLGGKGNLQYGISSGFNYQTQNSEVELESYHDTFNEFDKDGKYYEKNIEGKGIFQEEKLNYISIPVHLKLGYSLKHRWGSKYVKEGRSKSLPYRKGLDINFAVGPEFGFLINNSPASNKGTYSYYGIYKFTADSIPIKISDLPEYGFVNDTSFIANDDNIEYSSFSFGLSSYLTLTLPLSKCLDFYIGPKVYYEFTTFANKVGNFILSSQIGEAYSVSQSSKSSSFSYGVIAGISLNLHNIRNPHSKFHIPSFDKNEYFTNQYQLAKSYLVKKQIGIILYPTGYHVSKTKVNYTITAAWQKKSIKGILLPGKQKEIKYQQPSNIGSIDLKGNLIIHKPFGYEISSEADIIQNNINSENITINLADLNAYSNTSNLLELNIEQLKEFSFIYISLYNPLETKEQRKKLVGKVRQIGNEAIYNSKELVVYVSTEINQPKAFCNFSGEELKNSPNIYSNWEKFLRLLETEWNSRDLEYNEDIHNLENILDPLLKLSEKINANRRFVDYSFIVNQSEKYFGITPDEPSEMHKLIIYITNKYCQNVPFDSKQYSMYVYVNEKTTDPKITIRDINSTIETQNQIFNEK